MPTSGSPPGSTSRTSVSRSTGSQFGTPDTTSPDGSPLDGTTPCGVVEKVMLSASIHRASSAADGIPFELVSSAGGGSGSLWCTVTTAQHHR